MAPGDATAPEGGALLDIEVICSPCAGEVVGVRLSLRQGATAGEAVAASGLLQAHPGACGDALRVGVWGRPVGPDQALEPGDRVEIYRGLKADPKEARRTRYRAQGERGRKPRASGGSRGR